jgi:hypothetical protein
VAKSTINISPEELCRSRAKGLLPFVELCYNLEFVERPAYAKLKHCLVKLLLKDNKVPDVLFDWSKFKVPKVKLNGKQQ